MIDLYLVSTIAKINHAFAVFAPLAGESVLVISDSLWPCQVGSGERLHSQATAGPIPSICRHRLGNCVVAL